MSSSNPGSKVDFGPALIRAFQDGLIVRDPDGRIRQVNDAICDMLACRPEDLLGQSAPHFFWPPDQRDAMLASLQEALAGQRWERDFQYLRHDGARIDVILSTAALFDDNNQPSGCITIVKDITDRKRQERELARAKESAEAANRAKDQFLAVLSHELRTPLTPVLMSVHQILSKNPAPDVAAELEMIRRNVELEARLIDDLLDLTRIARGRLQLNLERIDAHRLLTSAVDICTPQLRARQIRLNIDFAARRHFVFADPARLQQVFWNILANAVKFTPPGGDVTLRTFDRDDYLHIEVQDSGIGINPESLPRIFDAFEQAEGPVARKFGGLGLGLAISRALVRLHWGHIAAHSEGHGKGSTFTIRLPAQEPAPENPTRQVQSESSRDPGQSPVDHVRPRRILMVEDHDDTRNILERMLRRSGYEVRSASTVGAAIRSALAEPFDILISDIGLPDGSGLEVMAYLKRLDSFRSMCGIALSGFGMDEDIRRSREAGFAHHLTKPVSFDRLKKLLNELQLPAE